MRLKGKGKRKDRAMKCVQKDNRVKRVPDSEARKLVEDEGWKYVPKSTWKETRPAKGETK